MADRANAGRGNGAARHFLHPRSDLLTSAGQGPDYHGQQPLQRLAHGGRLARQIGRNQSMRLRLWVAVAAASALVTALPAGTSSFAQKAGGVLKLSHFDSPASMSILEESTRAALQPMMGV